MLGNGRLFEGESVNNLADGAFFKGEEGQDIAAARFGDGVESVGGGRSSWHEANIYPYRNMSSTILAAGLAQVLAGVGGSAGDGKAASSLPAPSRPHSSGRLAAAPRTLFCGRERFYQVVEEGLAFVEGLDGDAFIAAVEADIVAVDEN